MNQSFYDPLTKKSGQIKFGSGLRLPHDRPGLIWVKDNLERSEREALKNFRNWNKEGNKKIIRIQDKSARLVIDSKKRIIEETKNGFKRRENIQKRRNRSNRESCEES